MSTPRGRPPGGLADDGEHHFATESVHVCRPRSAVFAPLARCALSGPQMARDAPRDFEFRRQSGSRGEIVRRGRDEKGRGGGTNEEIGRGTDCFQLGYLRVSENGYRSPNFPKFSYKRAQVMVPCNKTEINKQKLSLYYILKSCKVKAVQAFTVEKLG